MEDNSVKYVALSLVVFVLIAVSTYLAVNSSRSRGDNAQLTRDIVPTATPVISDLPKENQVELMEDGEMTPEEKTKIAKPSTVIESQKKYTALVTTNMGVITIDLDSSNRPITVNNFVYLANLGFYNNTIFHRVIPDFMIQGGDPLGNGRGGPNYKFEDELTGDNKNNRGTISMANAGPNTNGSQFFINVVDNNYLDTKHTVFGTVVSGMDIVDLISKVKTGSMDKPISDIVIEGIVIEEKL